MFLEDLLGARPKPCRLLGGSERSMCALPWEQGMHAALGKRQGSQWEGREGQSRLGEQQKQRI